MIALGRKKPPELDEQITSLESAAALAEGRLDPAHVEFARNMVDKGRKRLRHGTEHTVAAMLGPTGAGKSSLVNALVADDVATAGLRRPTTSSTLACVWGDHPGSGELLDWLEVPNRHGVAATGDDAPLDGLIVLDVPDHDSVEVSHRLEMERIAEHVDLLIWVTDPEKYADKTLHDYLRYLAGHSAVTLVVLNKTDQLDADDLAECRRDLSRLLVDDGVPGATVLTTSAADHSGVDELRSILKRAVAERATAVARIRADLAVAASELEADAGGGAAAEVTKRATGRLTNDLIDATGMTDVVDAVEASTRRDATATMGWPLTRWARKLRPDPLRRLHLDTGSAGRTSLPASSSATMLRASGAVRAFADELTSKLDEPWPTNVRNATDPDDAVLRDRLDTSVAEAVRLHRPSRPGWWKVIGALQWLLAAAMVVGVVWLGVLFVLAWFQIPEPPTPDWRGWPVPTLLALGGTAAGLILSFVGRRLAGISARRAGRRVRQAVAANVDELAQQLVVEPARAELATRSELLSLLSAAGADARLVAVDNRAAQ